MSPIGSFRQYQQFKEEEPSTSGLSETQLTDQYLPKSTKTTFSEGQSSQMTHTSSPLSDTLLLALRRSRPNTRFIFISHIIQFFLHFYF